MKKEIIIAPSILSADFSKLGRDIEVVEKAGAEWLHIDIMDGHFVPNLTIGPAVVSSIKKHSKMFFDVHLMIDRPDLYWRSFAKAGADLICFHVEPGIDRAALIKDIKKAGIKAGMTLKPGTPASSIVPYIEELDMILVMTVEPGFGGQKFMADMMGKVSEFRKYIDSKNPACRLQVDGGINTETAVAAVSAGADVLVAGNSVFAENDPAEAVRNIRKAASSVV